MNGAPYPSPPGLACRSYSTHCCRAPIRKERFSRNASYRFTDWFNLGAGLRFARNEQYFEQTLAGLLSGGHQNIPAGSFGRKRLGLYGKPQIQVGKRPDALRANCDGLSARWSEYRRARNTTAVNSSTVTSYEGGLKSEFFDHRLLFDIAGYHISWEDIQVGVVVNGTWALVKCRKGGDEWCRTHDRI